MYEGIGIALILLGIACAASILTGYWSLRCPKTAGMVTDYAEYEFHQSSTTAIYQKRARIEYAYKVGIQKFQSRRISIGSSVMEADKLRPLLNGDSVDVYFCPFWPGYAVLHRGAEHPALVATSALVGVIVGCMLLIT